MATAVVLCALGAIAACGGSQEAGSALTGGNAGSTGATAGSGGGTTSGGSAGSATGGLPGTAGDAGGGGIPVGSHGVYVVGEGEPPSCSGFDPYSPTSVHCGWQIVLPDGADFAAVGGAGGSAGSSAHLCAIPILIEDLHPMTLNLAVDCEVILYASPDQGDESWQYDDVDSPTEVWLSDALCARVSRDGFERIDLLTGSCPAPLPP